MMNVQQLQAIHELYPQVVRTVGGIAYDVNGEEISYDINAVNEKVLSDQKSQDDAKASALAKLTALGLTQAEVTALIG